MEVGREPRGLVPPERVVVVRVVAHAVAKECAEALAARLLAAGHGVLDLLLEPELRERRDRALGQARRQLRERARRVEHLAPRLLEPVAVERAEDRVGPPRLGAQVGEVVDRRDAGVQHELAVERLGQRVPAAAGEGPDVGARVHRLRRHLLRQRSQLALRRAVPHDEPAAPLLERPVQILQALEQELGPRPGRVAAVKQALVEAEGRHHAIVALERGAQRGVVVHAQVA